MNNWKPVAYSILSHLEKAGLEIDSVHDGEEEIPFRHKRAASEDICSVDMPIVLVTHPDLPGRRLSVLIVLGNAPCETIADYTSHPAIDRACDAFYDAWENKKVPKV